MLKKLVILPVLLALILTALLVLTASKGRIKNLVPPQVAKHDYVVMAVGDIACGPNDQDKDCQDKRTAELIKSTNPDALFLLGDLQYQDGKSEDFQKFFGSTWQQFNSLAYPTPGNHDYLTPGATGYFNFYQNFYKNKQNKDYYSFNIGPWHLISLNSNCWAVAGCLADTPQEKWLVKDLQDNPSKCTLAFWHHPFYTSGRQENLTAYRDFWKDLYNSGADVVLNGHEHLYERFAPQDNLGNKNDKGIREFVVGTGGINLYSFQKIQPNSEFRDNKDFGVLKLTLHSSSYDWQFISIDNQVLDAGSGQCH